MKRNAKTNFGVWNVANYAFTNIMSDPALQSVPPSKIVLAPGLMKWYFQGHFVPKNLVSKIKRSKRLCPPRVRMIFKLNLLCLFLSPISCYLNQQGKISQSSSPASLNSMWTSHNQHYSRSSYFEQEKLKHSDCASFWVKILDPTTWSHLVPYPPAWILT